MNILRFLTFIFVAILSSSIQSNGKPSEFVLVQFISCDSIKIYGKLWIPSGKSGDKLVIAVAPCLVSEFKPNPDPKLLRFDLMLRDKLLETGTIYFEFAGRKDSILKHNRRVPLSTMFTKVQDLKAAIAYIRSRPDLQNKKISSACDCKEGCIIN